MRCFAYGRGFAYGLLGIQFIIAAAAGADTLIVTADRDSTLFEDSEGRRAGGAGTALYAGMTRDGDLRRALIGFDLSAIPPGSQILGVELRLSVNRESRSVAADDATLHRVDSDWSEGVTRATDGRGEIAQDGDTTWLHARFDDRLWRTPGGDFAATASARAAFPASVDSVNGTPLRFGPDDALSADVQRWVDEPERNFGWLLRGDETAVSARRLSSREADGDGAPTLSVEFTPPPPIFDDGFES